VPAVGWHSCDFLPYVYYYTSTIEVRFIQTCSYTVHEKYIYILRTAVVQAGPRLILAFVSLSKIKYCYRLVCCSYYFLFAPLLPPSHCLISYQLIFTYNPSPSLYRSNTSMTILPGSYYNMSCD